MKTSSPFRLSLFTRTGDLNAGNIILFSNRQFVLGTNFKQNLHNNTSEGVIKLKYSQREGGYSVKFPLTFRHQILLMYFFLLRLQSSLEHFRNCFKNM